MRSTHRHRSQPSAAAMPCQAPRRGRADTPGRRVQSLVQPSGRGGAWRPYEYVRPWIRLPGKWLADTGFAATRQSRPGVR
jgi:hypothetical protein